MARTEVTGSQIKDRSVDLILDVTGILPIENGGTGSTTFALNNVLLGNGTGALQAVSPGTSGNVLTSNGTTWVSAAPAALGVVTTTGTQTLTNKTLTSPTLTTPVINGVPSGTGVATGTSSAANTLMMRDGSGHAYANYLNMAHAATTNNSDTIFYSSTDDYIRKNTAAGFKTSLALNNVDNTSDATKNSAAATLTNKTLTNPKITGAITGTYSFSGTPTWPTFNQSTTGSAATLTTARTIGGVSFNGSANINLPGVNIAGNQNTTGNAATATNATQVGGFSASTSATANTVAVRQADGYLFASYFSNNHAVTTRSTETIFYSSTDDLIRKNNATGFKTSLALNNVNNTSDVAKPVSTATQTALNLKENTANKAVANGYASLDSNGKVPGSQLPNSIMTYQGLHNASTNSPALTNASGAAGQVYRISVAGTRNYGAGNIELAVGDYLIHNGTAWEKADTTDAVSTVAGKTGNVTLVKGDVGLGNVDNTSDATKNVLSATKLTTARTIGGVSFNGSANINLPGVNTTGNQNTTGNAATATTLQTARTINGVSFNGSANITIADSTKEPKITAGTTAQYWRGDKTWQPLNATAVGLGSVNNTSDATKNAATATLTNKTISGSSNTLSNISINSLSDAARLFNNSGLNHGGTGTFDAQGATNTQDFGWKFYNASTNSPGTAAAGQYYTTIVGLGNSYAYNTYSMQIAYPRNTATPYISIRYQENGVLGAWQKISAGKADTLTTARTIGGVSFNGSANINLPGVNTTGNQNTTGSAATLTTARTIGGVSFNGSANINLPGVNTAGNQNTTGNAATATNATQVGGFSASTSAAGNTVAVREGSGYLFATYFNNNHAVTTRNSETIFYTSTDDYIRKNTVAGAKTSLGLNNVNNTSDATKNSAAVTLTNKTLAAPTVTDYTESVVTVGTVTTSHTFSLTGGTIQNVTLTASTACTFTMPTAAAGKSFTVFLKQAATTGGGSATFTGVKWSADGAPTITTTAAAMDIIFFTSDGTNWYGSYSQGFMP